MKCIEKKNREDVLMGRKLYVLKAEGPTGKALREAVYQLISELGVRIDAIIMIDFALKLEMTGAIAEGTTRFSIPVHAIIVKQSVKHAITVMKFLVLLRRMLFRK